MRASDLETLELAGLLEALSRHAVSQPGTEACLSLTARTDRFAVAEELARVNDAREITEEERAPLGAFPDIRPILVRAATSGTIIDAEHCLSVAAFLETTRSLRSWLRARGAAKPRLLTSAEQLDPLPELAGILDRCLDPEGGLRDDASPQLQTIRRKLRQLRSNIESRLERLFRGSSGKNFADHYVTVRNGRFVVPLRASASGSLAGIVQDRSTSGETLFIEPLTAVEDNNQLLLAAREEIEEEARILAELTREIGERAPILEKNSTVLIDLDTLFARVVFAREHDAICPRISETEIHLPGARHPLLELTGREVTPIDIELAADLRLLVITGPNTGGKSVALKTLGLSAVMVQHGIPILANPEARLPVFDAVFADIGDRQNVTDDLSTFSGHVVNLAEILTRATGDSLVLLDEPGTGTDPEDGAALAGVLLDEFGRRGTHVLATTHFQAVKMSALSREHATVAAVDFDPETYAPRYRLLYDSIGPSLGLDMARRLGLPANLVDRAETERGEQAADLGQAIDALEKQRRRLEQEEARTLDERVRLAAERAEQERLLDELRAKKKRKWADELGAARRFAEELRREGRRLLDEAKQRPSESARNLVNLAREQRKKISAESDRRHATPGADTPTAAPLAIGDPVEIMGNGITGEIVEISGNRANIARGKVRFDVQLDQLRRLEKKEAVESSHRGGGFRVQRAETASRDENPATTVELNLIGERVRPALERLEKFLDGSTLDSLGRVRIIHGHGTGALRAAVRERLGNSPQVEHFEEAPPNQGGTGATIAYLRG